MATRPVSGGPGAQRWSDRVGGRFRVLLIESNDACADPIVSILKDVSRATVIRAKTIPDGFASKSAHRPDVIIIDVTEFGPWGKIAVEAVSMLAEDAPVIALVADDDDALLHDALRAGAQEYFVKGDVAPEVLKLTIRNARERHRLIRVHQRTEGRFRHLVNDIPEPAVVTDMQGEIHHLNPPAVTMFPDLELGNPLAKTGIHVLGPQPEMVTLGDQRQVEVRCSRIEWEGRPAWLVLIRDASMQVQLDDLKARLAHAEKLAVIGELAAGVAHEINNPLAFILANLSAALGHVHGVQDVIKNAREATRGVSDADSIRVVLDDAGPELFAELREILEDNLDGVDRIRAIVRDLRTFSRRENEERELVRVHEMIKSACHMLGSMIRHRATLIKDLQPVPPVMGNRVKLTQILTNLLINAIQALPDHRGREERIEIRTTHDDRWVSITVTDTGTGVDETVQDRIFEPFFTTKSRESGTGIGLSLSAELARQHDGELLLVETSPEGSTFELRLPAAESVRLVRRETESSHPPGATIDPTRRRILLVDDEPYVRRSMMRMLRDYEVTAASNGREALALVDDEDFDLVICDLVMPDLDGVDVHEALAASNPSMLGRVIYTSGGAYTPRTASFVAKNDIMFVEKPVHPKRLIRMIEDVLRST